MLFWVGHICTLVICQGLSKNFHSETDGVFFHMTCLVFLTCSVLLSVYLCLVTLFTLFICVCFSLTNLSLFLWSKLFPWTMGVFRSTSQALHQHGQNLHIQVLLRYSSWKKTCNFWVWIEALTVIITKSSLLDNCCPICPLWFVRSSSHSESNFSHIFIDCNNYNTLQ